MITSTQDMTPAQQKRFTELMMRDMASVPFSSSPAMMSAIPPMPRVGLPITSIDDLLDNIESNQIKRAEMEEIERHTRIDRMFNREELFRIAYVPFVIAELVWDYADTVIILAKSLNNPATRRLSRAIRNARSDYDRLRHQYIDDEHRKRELENGYVFEDAIQSITNQLLINLRVDINSEYPNLNESSRDLLIAVHQCSIMSKALLRYLAKQSARIETRVGHAIGKMLPPSYYVMDKLIPEFIGDKPASAHFNKLMQQYIETLSVQMALVELNDITDNKEQQ